MTRGSKTFQFSTGWTVMPTRLRERTSPIDSRMRIVSRATVRETPNRSRMESRVSTWSQGRSPLVISAPMVSSTVSCRTPAPGCVLTPRAYRRPRVFLRSTQWCYLSPH